MAGWAMVRRRGERGLAAGLLAALVAFPGLLAVLHVHSVAAIAGPVVAGDAAPAGPGDVGRGADDCTICSVLAHGLATAPAGAPDEAPSLATGGNASPPSLTAGGIAAAAYSPRAPPPIALRGRAA